MLYRPMTSRTSGGVRAALGVGCLLGAIAFTGCGRATTSPTTSTQTQTPPAGSGNPTADVTISIVGSSGTQAFTPNPAAARVGQTFVFRNTVGNTHRIVADTGAWDAGTVASGATSTVITASGVGSVAFHCTIHGSMTGSLTVSAE